jgi:hypothetical protein
MPVERSEKLLGHWRTILFCDASKAVDSILFCFDQCIFCSFQTQSGDVSSRSKQIAEHEKAHPKESEAREFYRFRQSLHSAAMNLCPYNGLDAFQWRDREEWRIYFERFLHMPENTGAEWGDYIKSLFATAKEWRRSPVTLS